MGHSPNKTHGDKHMKIARVTLLILCALTFLSIQASAQRNITVINPSFEKPDSGKIEGFNGKTTHTGTGYKVLVVPGWNVDSPDSSCFDSGIEAKATSAGKYDAFLMSGDSAIYQTLPRRAFDDDQLKLWVDARNSYNVTAFLIELYYLNGDSAKAPRVVLASAVNAPTSTMATYTLKVSSIPAAASGHHLGILIHNISPTASWLEIDNIRLTNEDSTIVEVPNYSFEQPDSGKIGGFNGPGSGTKPQSDSADVPGWATDSTVYDSGIETGQGAQDGIYTAYMEGSDTSIWNTTNYTIKTGDVLSLRVMGRVTYASTVLHSELYYVDGTGKRVTLAFSEDALNVDYSWAEYSVGVDISTVPAAVGKRLGVLFKNASPVGSSWAAIDLVRVNANHSVVLGVPTTKIEPTDFSLAQNYPNPFNPSTKIAYTLKNSGKVTLTVFDLLGKQVATLVNSIQTAGSHQAVFSGSGLSSGVYFYRLQTSEGSLIHKMVLMK